MTQTQTREIFDLFRRTARLIHGGYQEGALTKAEFFLMSLLYEDGSANVTALAEKLSVSKTTASKLIRSAEEKGYVERLTEPEDRRVAYIRLTDHGKDMTKRCLASHRQNLLRIIERIGEEDTRALIRILSKIVEKGERE